MTSPAIDFPEMAECLAVKRKALADDGGEEILAYAADVAVPAAVAHNASLKSRWRKFNLALAPVEEVVAKQAACRQGCSHCCNIAVTLPLGEAEVISANIGVKIDPNFTPAKSRVGEVGRFEGTPCPFLKNNQCSIYDNRPIACRAYFNFSDFPDLCDLERNPGAMVPTLDMDFVYEQQVLLFKSPVMADIREFFPNGLG